VNAKRAVNILILRVINARVL